MTDENTKKALIELISVRQELAVSRLKTDPEFMELVKRREISKSLVNELYTRFTKSERLTIEQHYENELGKEILVNEKIYLQGLRDCFALFDFLSGKEVQL